MLASYRLPFMRAASLASLLSACTGSISPAECAAGDRSCAPAANIATMTPVRDVTPSAPSTAVPPLGPTSPTGGPGNPAPIAPAPGAQAPGLPDPQVPGMPGADTPCDVANVVSRHCTLCHAQQPRFGAPMPLMTRADFLAASKRSPTRKVFEVTPARLAPSDPVERMPPVSSPALAAEDLQRFSAWLNAGAQASGPLCRITEASDPSLPPTTGSTTTAPPRVAPIEYDDPELKCYKFVSHAPDDETRPYAVETTPDAYKGFNFVAPWQGMMYAKSFRPVIDNAAVIHHWLFFKTARPGGDGDVSDESGAHPDGQLMHGWAPGADPMYLEPDVGEEMPGNAGYLLEAHYNNTTGAVAQDMSGVEICVTPRVPKHIASVSWLGTDNISGTSASGTCRPRSNQPIQLINIVPHMHLAGRHMKVTIHRANGTDEMLHDQPFDFENQVTYPKTHKLMPGDTITTECTYSEPKVFGRGTNDEMCYLFTAYYPKLALTNGDLLWSTLHGPDTCLQ